MWHVNNVQHVAKSRNIPSFYSCYKVNCTPLKLGLYLCLYQTLHLQLVGKIFSDFRQQNVNAKITIGCRNVFLVWNRNGKRGWRWLGCVLVDLEMCFYVFLSRSIRPVFLAVHQSLEQVSSIYFQKIGYSLRIPAKTICKTKIANDKKQRRCSIYTVSKMKKSPLFIKATIFFRNKKRKFIIKCAKIFTKSFTLF